MGLSDDQRAMLRMVAQRGEAGYEDIAALMGLSVDEVRAKVSAALAELDREGALEASAQAPEAPPREAAARTEAEPEPAPSEESGGSEPKRRSPSRAAGPPRRRSPGMPSGTVLRAAVAGGLIVVALVAIALIVGGGGEGESQSAGGSSTTAAGQGAAAGGSSSNPREVTKAVLKAVDGSGAEGVAVFGRVKKSLALEVAAEGLTPTASGEEYTIWLSDSPQKMLPLASVAAPKGRIAAQIAVPVEVLAYLADETFTELAVTRTENSRLAAALKKATKAKQTTPEYTGEEVLRGAISGPIVGAAKRLKERSG